MNKSSIVLLIFLGLIAICIHTCHDESCTENKSHNILSEKTESNVLKNEAEQINLRYLKTVQHLIKENDSLSFVIKSNKELLDVSRKKTLLLQAKIKSLTNKVSEEKDTLQKISICDSLGEGVRSFITASSIRDSLCDNTVEQLSNLIVKKDSAINFCKESFLRLKSATDKSFSAQQRLADELNFSDKALRKEKRKNRWLLMGMVAVSSSATTFLLKK